MLADVGLVGFPSVGKSTIISKVSKAKPKIAAYHFTTLTPNLGVVKTNDNRSFVMADLPGLIEGASKGEGLGDRFLKHIERTKVIAHVIDMSGSEDRNPYEDYLKINKELELFSSKLIKKPMIIIANKMDIEKSQQNLIEFKKKLANKNIKIFETSALNEEGLKDCLIELANLVDSIKEEPLFEEDQFEGHVLYKFKKEEPYKITKENDTWVISGEALEKLFRMTKFTDEGIRRFTKKLRYMGVDEKLEELGAKDKDIVKIFDFEFEWKK